MSSDADGAGAPRDLASARALAALLPCGVLLIDARAELAFASARACALLGSRDEAALHARWNELREAVGTGAGPADAAHGYAEVDVAGERRRLRMDSYRVGDDGAAHHLVLLEDPRSLDDGLAVLVAAGRAQAQQHVLVGILHDLNGRLNNFNLTLTLLETTLARHAPQAPVEPLLERCRRYGAALTNEARRLADALQPLATLVSPEAPADTGIDVGRLLEETRHALRHATVLHEIALAASADDGVPLVRGDGALLRLALLDIVIGLMACTAPGGQIAMSAAADGDDVVVRFTARGTRIPAATLRAFDRITLTAPASALDLLAARAIIAAQGGSVTLQSHDEDARIDARLARQARA